MLFFEFRFLFVGVRLGLFFFFVVFLDGIVFLVLKVFSKVYLEFFFFFCKVLGIDFGDILVFLFLIELLVVFIGCVFLFFWGLYE